MSNFTGASVLLAEDNPVSQEVARSILQFVGIEVDIVETGLSAVTMARDIPYDLILMDIQMPVMDGLQATRLLRESSSTSSVPIIALTTNAAPGDRDACIAAGMNDYLVKPVDPQVLYQMLSTWLPSSTDGSKRGQGPGDADNAERTATIAGVDMARGLKYFAGNENSYLRALDMFVNLSASSLEAAQAWQAQPGPALRNSLYREIHSLGGACAAIGAQDLSERAVVLAREVSGVAPDALLLPEIASLQRDLTALVAAIRAHLQAAGRQTG